MHFIWSSLYKSTQEQTLVWCRLKKWPQRRVGGQSYLCHLDEIKLLLVYWGVHMIQRGRIWELIGWVLTNRGIILFKWSDCSIQARSLAANSVFFSTCCRHFQRSTAAHLNLACTSQLYIHEKYRLVMESMENEDRLKTITAWSWMGWISEFKY